MENENFWIGQWLHAMPKEYSDRIDIIVNLCFGPLETEIYGIKAGEFFREYHIIEGIGEGAVDFKIIDRLRFSEVLENEIELSKNHNCHKRAEILIKYKNKFEL